ncbi:MAG: hypothetical protein JAZ03_08575 [Candidatus Thiodiazotropha taylori]|nr:hypothetical protein [Candidatus Thiodiazotropha taylori]MCW4333979.1 reverse transcriptase domain-containing protein [Candidatus Thiodiazotropha endolucinida]
MSKKEEMEIYVKENSPDIICITELLPKRSFFTNQEQFYQIEGYDLFSNDLSEGRGLAIYIKIRYSAVKLHIESVFKEALWCTIKLQNSDVLLFGCIYRSPNATEENFLQLQSLFRNVCTRRESHKLIMGDFNFREINWETITANVGEQHMSSRFIETIRDTFLFQHIKRPTRFREGNEPSTLDLVFSNEEDMIDNVSYLTGLDKSDHLILTFDFKCYTLQTNQDSTQQGRLNFFKGDYDAIREDLAKVDWDDAIDGEDLRQSWTGFTEANIKMMKKHIPVSKPPSDGRRPKPKVSRSCLDAIKMKRRKWLKYLYCKNDPNFNEYKAARNKATYELKQSKYHYEKSLATKIKTDPKIFWKYVRSKAKTKSTVSKLQMDGGLLSTNDQETATTLNNYFTTVFEKEPDGPLPHFTERTYNQVLENIEITESKIGKVVDALNASKSQGPDDFHPKYLKETKEQLTYPLKVIFEKSLNEGKLPDEWKKANVSAIFKSGEKQKPENYRPISLTSVPGKVMEKIIRNAIVQHMTDNNLFNPSQHGFIKGKSCLTQLLEFIEDVSQAIDDGYNVDVIYLDFKKAFDKVPHQRLLLKLQNYGIKGQVYEWVKDFLSDRVQRVMVNGTPSEWAEVSSGIPQGSVLGPILFLVYINDMPDVIAVLIKLYADDAKIYNRVSITDRNNQVQTSLDNSVDWANEWLMYYNFKKCHHLQIGRQEIDSKYSMKAGNETHELNKVKNEKDLGVIIDSNLLFRDHITSKVNLANRNLGIIFRSFTFIDQDMFLHLYKSLVRPHIEYASPVWSPHFKKDSIMIENVQRRATRLVRSLKGYSYSERLRKLGLPTLEYRRERADLIQVYKILNNIDILDKDKLFTVVQRATRGHSFKLYKRRSRLVSRANCFSNRVINAWNSLPETVVCAPSVNAFKNRLNNHWRGHPYKFEAACYQAGQVNRNVNYLNAPQEAEGLLYGVDDR